MSLRRYAPLMLVVLPILLVLETASPRLADDGVWIVGLTVAAFLAVRLLAIGLGALGWIIFPPEHRALLGEIAARHEAARPEGKTGHARR